MEQTRNTDYGVGVGQPKERNQPKVGENKFHQSQIQLFRVHSESHYRSILSDIKNNYSCLYSVSIVCGSIAKHIACITKYYLMFTVALHAENIPIF